MKTYTLTLSTSITTNNQNITIIDETYLFRCKWSINWGQFFKYDDYNKKCHIRAKLVSKKSALLTHDGNLGFLSVSLPAINSNLIEGLVLGQTIVYGVPNSTDFYLSCDTLQESGVQSIIPSQASELIVSLTGVDGLNQFNIPEYILTLVFSIDDEE
jgi:hypothetical protein